MEIDRAVDSSGTCQLGSQKLALGSALANKRVTLRLDGHLVHVLCQGVLAKTLPCPIAADERGRLRGARLTTEPLPPPPAGPIQVERRVPADGVVMVTRQRIRVGRTYAGKTVTILIEDTCLRVLHNGEELSLHHRTTNQPVTRIPCIRLTPAQHLSMSRMTPEQSVSHVQRPHNPSDLRNFMSADSHRSRTRSI